VHEAWDIVSCVGAMSANVRLVLAFTWKLVGCTSRHLVIRVMLAREVEKQSTSLPRMQRVKGRGCKEVQPCV
jgi:hypothetical protein